MITNLYCVKTFAFKTKAEAKAFAEGVEYVNDSSIEFVWAPKPYRRDPTSDSWLVELRNQDESRGSDE